MMAGIGRIATDEELKWQDYQNSGNCNYIAFFGCPPTKKVPAKSTLACSFFEQLKMKASAREDRMVYIPQDITMFNGSDGFCEKVVLVKSDLKLPWQGEIECVSGYDKVLLKSQEKAIGEF